MSLPQAEEIFRTTKVCRSPANSCRMIPLLFTRRLSFQKAKERAYLRLFDVRLQKMQADVIREKVFEHNFVYTLT